jgi:hypothetical protein
MREPEERAHREAEEKAKREAEAKAKQDAATKRQAAVRCHLPVPCNPTSIGIETTNQSLQFAVAFDSAPFLFHADMFFFHFSAVDFAAISRQGFASRKVFNAAKKFAEDLDSVKKCVADCADVDFYRGPVRKAAHVPVLVSFYHPISHDPIFEPCHNHIFLRYTEGCLLLIFFI